MHIAFLSNEYPPLPSGGIGTSVRNLARALVVQGHRVSVVGWGSETEFDDEGVRVHFLGHTALPKMGWWSNRLRAQRELNRMVRDQSLDIVEASDWSGPSAGMRLDCPLVIRCHGSATYFGQLTDEKVRPSVRLAERTALRHADAVAAVSRFTGEKTQQIFGLDQPIVVIHNGIDVEQFQPADPGDVEPDTILYLGTLVRKKGVLDLCEIFSNLAERHPGARLRLVGRDSADSKTGTPSTWALCQRLLTPRALKRTEYLGPQPYDQVQQHLHRAAICVFPSHAEALPLSWLEAMACAKPLVAYDIGWAPEMIEHSVNGMLIPLGAYDDFVNTLTMLLADIEKQFLIGSAARQRVEEKFSSEVIASQSLAWYSGVINTHH